MPLPSGLQLGPLGGDTQPESSTFSPTDSGEDRGQPSPGVQYRRQNQRRFSMEVRGSGLYAMDVMRDTSTSVCAQEGLPWCQTSEVQIPALLLTKSVTLSRLRSLCITQSPYVKMIMMKMKSVNIRHMLRTFLVQSKG